MQSIHIHIYIYIYILSAVFGLSVGFGAAAVCGWAQVRVFY